MSSYRYCDDDTPHEQHEWSEEYELFGYGERAGLVHFYCLGVKDYAGSAGIEAQIKRLERLIDDLTAQRHDLAISARRTMKEANLE